MHKFPVCLILAFVVSLFAISPADAQTPTITPTSIPFCDGHIYPRAPAIPIPDAGCPTLTQDTNSVGGLAGVVSKVSVRINITHTFDGDLNIYLVHPDGTQVGLSLGNGMGANFTDTVFDDDALTPIGTGTASFTGSYIPDEPLGALDGKAPNGNWKLAVCDQEAEDTGTLDNWDLCLETSTASTPTCTPTRTPTRTPTHLGSTPIYTPTAIAPPVAYAPWPMFRGNAQHTGQSAYAGSQTGTLLWSYHTGGFEWYGALDHEATSSPAIGSDGSVYMGSYDNRIYGLNSIGSLLWSYQTGYNVESSPAIGADGSVYVGSDDYNLYCLSSTGSLLWRYETNFNAVNNSPTIGSDGRIYTVGDWDMISCLSATGSVLWTYEMDIGSCSPAIGFDGMVYVKGEWGWPNRFCCFSSDGLLLWTYANEYSYVYFNPTIDSNGNVYVGSGDNGLYCFSAAGSVLWRYETGFPVESCPAIGSDGKVYLESADGGLYCFSAAGSVLWRYETGGGGANYSSPVIGSDGSVYMGSDARRIYGLNSTGSLMWSYVTYEYGNISAPAIGSDGSVYVLTDGGTFNQKLLVFNDKAATPIPPTPTPGGPTPPAQVILNGTSFGAGSQFTATFQLNEAVTRVFNAYAVVNLPDGSMLDAITLSSQIRPVATNVNGFPAGFSYPFMSLRIPPSAPKGTCSVMVGFFDPFTRITGPQDAFLLATTPFTLE